MKILFINTGPWGTGSFTVIKGLMKELLILGHQVKVLFPDANFESIDKNEYYQNTSLYEIWEFPIQNDVTSIPTFPLMITDPHPRNPYPITFKSFSKEQHALYEQELTKKIVKLIDAFKPDIVECHHIWYSGWVCHKLNLDYLVVAHHSDQLGFRYDSNMQPKALTAARSAKKIVAISEIVKKEVIRMYDVDQSNVIVSENGYDKDVFQKRNLNKSEVLSIFGIHINADAKIISFAGKLSHTKGIDILLRANKLLDPKMNVHFIVMGAGDIKTICEKMENGTYSLNNMHFLGHRTPEELSRIHNIADIGVMPSRSEGFGISCLEAMGCGLPMVVSRCHGPDKFAIGKIIDIGSPNQLAEAIVELLSLPAEDYEKLSAQAIQAAQKFSWRTIIERRLELYEAMLNR